MISKNIINTLKEVIWDSRKSEYINNSILGQTYSDPQSESTEEVMDTFSLVHFGVSLQLK